MTSSPLHSSTPNLTKNDGNDALYVNTRKRKDFSDNPFSIAMDSFSDEITQKLSTWKLDLETTINYMNTNLQATVKSELADVTTSISELRSDLNVAVSNFNIRQTEMTADINELKSSVEFNSGKQDDFDSQLKKLENTISEIKNSNQDVADLRSQVAELKQEINQQKQWDRLLNLEVSNVPESKNEDLFDIVIKIAKHAGVQLKPQDIVHATRVQPFQQNSTRIKSIVFKLTKRIYKDNIIAGLRTSKGVTTRDISLSGDNPNDSKKIFVSEHLTVENKMLHKKCRDAQKAREYQFLWTKNCKIMMRKDKDSDAIHIREEADLRKLR